MEKALVLTVLVLSVLPFVHSLRFNTTPATCSSVCESSHCKDPPELRYGKYCGVGYTGCSGQAPCDGLDACCQAHDNCVGSGDLANYVNTGCSDQLLNCVDSWDKSNAAQFTGNTCDRGDVVDTIADVMKLIILNGNLGSTATILRASPVLLSTLMVAFFIYLVMHR
ncbi:hypothetical protein R1sor_003267 [Riccia sorocarpa]|uniref:Phospholipase A2 n=1 Tax=Riccia sorocarpa TaxID=122646 RepID=A0ABD3H136_9MARC